MKQESIEELKQKVIAVYKKKGDSISLIMKTKPGKNSWTGNEIAKEIEEETALGIKMIDKLIQLTIDLISREKIDIDQ